MVWFNQQNARPDMPDVPEQHPVEFPNLAKFTADVDDESSSVSENLPGIIGGKKICPPVSASDGENHSDTCPTNLGIPESGTRPARPSARIRNHMTISASTNNTRTGTITRPKRFLDIDTLDKMPEVICSYCDTKYASRGNLKRHINAVHNSNVRYVGCNEPNCDRIFFRREPNVATSTHYDPRGFYWRGFIHHMEEEQLLCEHAEALRRTEVVVELVHL
ncbi:unnamed protein product [Mytilus coruscus]|uniref:C2H2-type domain-containing protein n=1 Tax=Mytilus coruscus TaxID=42192 RepID=A0A6J8E9V1_MYTCO|nr:unnamed protein product [Mytilus coruscus]